MKRHLASVISPTRTPQAQTAAGSPPASSRGLAGGLSVIEGNTDGRDPARSRTLAGRPFSDPCLVFVLRKSFFRTLFWPQDPPRVFADGNGSAVRHVPGQ